MLNTSSALKIWNFTVYVVFKVLLLQANYVERRASNYKKVIAVSLENITNIVKN